MHPAHTVEPRNRNRDAVVTCTAADRAHRHDGVTQAAIATRLAALKGYHFAGEYDTADRPSGRVYFVPGATMVGVAAANALGVRTEADLFGGVVPHHFVATKAITHALVEPDAAAPEGWSHGFGRRVLDVVLPGFTAFTLQDARKAGLRLLERGPVRLKQPLSAGWRDQIIVAAPGELEAALDDLDPNDLFQHGLVLEQNLDDVTTYSVGQVRLDGLTVTYFGTQCATPDNAGATVYGGSNLLVVRGDYGALLGLGPTPAFHLAIAQARAYDAATEEFAGFFASRRNYDVAGGRDAQGRWRCGVLESSWRIGGASGPEVAALEAFRADAALTAVRAWCVESYGPDLEPPSRAVVHYHDVDERLGPLIKYTLTEPYVPPR
jgi:Protein of unknown function (DUF3182)